MSEGEFAVHSVLDDAGTAPEESHMHLDTENDQKNVRINSRDYTRTSGDQCAVQIKPNMSVTGTGGITGLEVSPRFADACAGSKLVGIMSNPDLKGSSGNLSSVIRCYEAKFDGGTGRTVVGPAYVLDCMTANAATITGGCHVIGVQNAGGGGTGWSSFIRFAGNQGGIWHSDPTTEPSTAAGYIKVFFGSTARYIQLYSTAPTD